MKIIFAGTPEFAIPTLQKLIDSKHEVVAVYTQPDRPAGRGRKLTPPPVKVLALQHGLPVMQPKTLRDNESQRALAELQPDVMVVVAYGLLLPQAVLDIPRYGCINIHPSLLPRWRGAAPIQHTLLAGDKETGVTIMQMNAGMDAGPILQQSKSAINTQETSGDLHDRLSHEGGELLLDTLKKLSANNISPQAQDEKSVTLATKFNKQDAKIDWSQSANQITNQIRAFNPWPVAHTNWSDISLRIWQAEPIPEQSSCPPGTLVKINPDSMDIACGDGMLRVLAVQLPGKTKQAFADFARGHKNRLVPNETAFE